MRKVGLLAGLFAVAFGAINLWAIQVNPTSNVICDSANTAETCIYRDTSGNFAAGTITAAALTVTGAQTIGGQLQLYTRTTSQIATLTPSASGYMIMNITVGTPCVSTGTGSGAWVYVSTSASSAKVVCGS